MVYLPTLIPYKSIFHGGVHIPVPWDAMGCPYFPSPNHRGSCAPRIRIAPCSRGIAEGQAGGLNCGEAGPVGKMVLECFGCLGKKGEVMFEYWVGKDVDDEWWMMMNDKWWRWMIIIDYCIIMIVIITMIPLCGRSRDFSANWSSCETWGEEVYRLYLMFVKNEGKMMILWDVHVESTQF